MNFLEWQLLLFSVTLIFPSLSQPQEPCYLSHPDAKDYIVDISEIPRIKYKNVKLPSQLDWRWHGQKTYTSRIRNSMSSKYCGSCWAFAAASTLSDRINIQINHLYPEWSLSPQTLIDCDEQSHGCQNGDPMTAWQYIKDHGIPSDTCSPYMAQSRKCDEVAKCMECQPGQSCTPKYPYQAWSIKQFAKVNGGEQGMIQSLQDGPIVCNIRVTPEFQNLNDFHIFSDDGPPPPGPPQLSISVVGYGTEGQTKYWIIRNSWGDYWGYHGYARIVRGTNTLAIEQECSWAQPSSNANWIRNTTDAGIVKNDDSLITIYSTNATNDEHKYHAAYPDSFSWTGVNGTNYLTPTRNQLAPKYCASDWAFAVTSIMSDRLNINRSATHNETSWPETLFSVQTLLNVGGDIKANCFGCGDLSTVLSYIEDNGVPVESCESYQAIDLSPNSQHICTMCNYPNNPTHCQPVHNYTSYKISKWGKISGLSQMQQAIYHFGPIVCEIDATQQFFQYTGGIFQQHLSFIAYNHYVEVVGWGAIPNNGSQSQYWIGRNSWGLYWGENGLFRIIMNSNNLGIENKCFYANPELNIHD